MLLCVMRPAPLGCEIMQHCYRLPRARRLVEYPRLPVVFMYEVYQELFRINNF
jgi:hypothetical protein